MSAANWFGFVLQVVLGAGVYSATVRGLATGSRFLWIRDLAQPNALLAIVSGLLMALASLLGPHLPQQSRAFETVLPAILTTVLAWRLASGVVRYWAASSAVSGFQGFLLHRRRG